MASAAADRCSGRPAATYQFLLFAAILITGSVAVEAAKLALQKQQLLLRMYDNTDRLHMNPPIFEPTVQQLEQQQQQQYNTLGPWPVADDADQHLLAFTLENGRHPVEQLRQQEQEKQEPTGFTAEGPWPIADDDDEQLVADMHETAQQQQQQQQQQEFYKAEAPWPIADDADQHLAAFEKPQVDEYHHQQQKLSSASLAGPEPVYAGKWPARDAKLMSSFVEQSFASSSAPAAAESSAVATLATQLVNDAVDALNNISHGSNGFSSHSSAGSIAVDVDVSVSDAAAPAGRDVVVDVAVTSQDPWGLTADKTQQIATELLDIVDQAALDAAGIVQAVYGPHAVHSTTAQLTVQHCTQLWRWLLCGNQGSLLSTMARALKPSLCLKLQGFIAATAVDEVVQGVMLISLQDVAVTARATLSSSSSSNAVPGAAVPQTRQAVLLTAAAALQQPTTQAAAPVPATAATPAGSGVMPDSQPGATAAAAVGSAAIDGKYDLASLAVLPEAEKLLQDSLYKAIDLILDGVDDIHRFLETMLPGSTNSAASAAEAAPLAAAKAAAEHTLESVMSPDADTWATRSAAAKWDAGNALHSIHSSSSTVGSTASIVPSSSAPAAANGNDQATPSASLLTLAPTLPAPESKLRRRMLLQSIPASSPNPVPVTVPPPSPVLVPKPSPVPASPTPTAVPAPTSPKPTPNPPSKPVTPSPVPKPVPASPKPVAVAPEPSGDNDSTIEPSPSVNGADATDDVVAVDDLPTLVVPVVTEARPDAPVVVIADVPVAVDVVTVSFLVRGVTSAAFDKDYLATSTGILSRISGTADTLWHSQVFAEASQVSAPGAASGDTTAHRRTLLQQQEQAMVANPLDVQSSVLFSLVSANPQLVVQRLTYPAIDFHSAWQVGCATEFCYRLQLAQVPFDAASIRITPAYDGSFEALADPPVTRKEAGSGLNVAAVVVGAAVGGFVLMLLLLTYSKWVAWCCYCCSAKSTGVSGAAAKQRGGKEHNSSDMLPPKVVISNRNVVISSEPGQL